MAQKAKRETFKQLPLVQPGIYHLEKEAKWGGFINIRLTDEQKTSFFDWYAENTHYSTQIIDQLLGEEMKISLAYDRENECYICTFTGKLMSYVDDRFVMTTRAGTLAETIALACWKHVFLTKGDYGAFMPRSGNSPSWG